MTLLTVKIHSISDMNEWARSFGGITMTGQKFKFSDKILSQWYFVHHKFNVHYSYTEESLSPLLLWRPCFTVQGKLTTLTRDSEQAVLMSDTKMLNLVLEK